MTPSEKQNESPTQPEKVKTITERLREIREGLKDLGELF
jgi:hypothetical protein